MVDINPLEADAVLGGNHPPPIDAAVLGGLLGQKQEFAHRLGLSIHNELLDQFFQQESIANALGKNHQLFEFITFTIDSYGEIVAQQEKQALSYIEDLGGNVTLDMVYIPAGHFLINYAERGTYSGGHFMPMQIDPKIITLKSFYMAKYPVTQDQYSAVMNTNPAHFQGDGRHPVENTTWSDAINFCERLSNLTNSNYHLPRESQWEYACRAGTTTPFHYGDTLTTDFANYDGSEIYANESPGVYLASTTPVGKYPPNSWGLHDMHGNVWEWCYEEDILTQQISSFRRRVLRGGSWCYTPQGCSSSAYIRTIDLYQAEGFRVCID